MTRDRERDVATASQAVVDGATVDTATGRLAESDISSQRVHSIFSRIAGRYDLFNQLSSMGIYRLWLKRVVRIAAARPNDRMLDLAAGTGDVSFAVATQSATPPASIKVTDFCQEMLDVAQQRYEAGAAGGVPCSFQVVDAQDIPFEDGSADLITCAYGVRNFPDRHKALEEAFRVLAPGGRYVILEFSTPPFAPWRVLYHAYLRVMIPLIGGILTGDRSGFVYLNDSIRAFPDQRTLARALESVGFTQVTWKNCSGGIAAIHSAVKPQ